ncbi:angiopoietin-related protein 7-like [Macrobrachium nipponense]|uniref:angiopoietin-related protein 7-like n=1 Tax=Macrobrachium nipponense TaxID=159736 RepID=UPI0030C85AAF
MLALRNSKVVFIFVVIVISKICDGDAGPSYYESNLDYNNDCIYQSMPGAVVNKLVDAVETTRNILENLLIASNITHKSLESLLVTSSDTLRNVEGLITDEKLISGVKNESATSEADVQYFHGSSRMDSKLLLHLLEKIEKEQERLWKEVALLKQSLEKRECSSNCGISSTESSTNTTEVLWSTLLHLQEDVRNLKLKVSSLPDQNARPANNCTRSPDRPKDCSEIAQQGQTVSGVFTIYPYKCGHTGEGVQVWCDLDGVDGWTIVLSRKPLLHQVDFNKNWRDYKMGFGDPKSEYWLGNDALHSLTSSARQILRINMEDWDGAKRSVEYNFFIVEGEDREYRLHVGGYSGDGGDSLAYHNNMAFTTIDHDNDLHDGNCATLFGGGFWYNKCHQVSATSVLLEKQQNTKGINWSAWYTDRTTLTSVVDERTGMSVKEAGLELKVVRGVSNPSKSHSFEKVTKNLNIDHINNKQDNIKVQTNDLSISITNNIEESDIHGKELPMEEESNNNN